MLTLLPWLLALAQPQAAPPAPAAPPPESWIAYAELVQYNLKIWLENAEEAPAVRLRTALHARYSDDPRAEIKVRLWADDTGRITRATLPDQPEVEPDLQAILVGKIVDEAPPPGLRWPITLAVRGIPVIGAGASSTDAERDRQAQ